MENPSFGKKESSTASLGWKEEKKKIQSGEGESSKYNREGNWNKDLQRGAKHTFNANVCGQLLH